MADYFTIPYHSNSKRVKTITSFSHTMKCFTITGFLNLFINVISTYHRITFKRCHHLHFMHAFICHENINPRNHLSFSNHKILTIEFNYPYCMTLLAHILLASTDSVDCKFILACMMETIKLFQHHGLKTSLLVCDGCAANLTTTYGQCGAYSLSDDPITTDKFKMKP